MTSTLTHAVPSASRANPRGQQAKFVHRGFSYERGGVSAILTDTKPTQLIDVSGQWSYRPVRGVAACRSEGKIS